MPSIRVSGGTGNQGIAERDCLVTILNAYKATGQCALHLHLPSNDGSTEKVPFEEYLFSLNPCFLRTFYSVENGGIPFSPP